MPTFTDGTVVHAVDLRPLAGSQPPTYRAHQNAGAQTFTNGTVTDVTFDTSDTDSDTGRTSTTVYTCKTAGLWLIYATMNWAGSVSGQRNLYVVVNGSIVRECDGSDPTTAAYTQAVNVAWPLAVNDTVKVQALQNSGGSLANALLGGGYAQIHMVRISN